MDQDDANIDPYLHLGLTPAASEKDIKSAYRKKSLGVHPDRNPDNPQAAHQFHLLTLSQAILLDGPKRAILDVRLEAAAKRAERTAGLESRKRGMVNDLVAREEAFKKSKLASASTNSNPNNSSAQETSIQSAGRRLREEAAAAAHAADDFARSEAKRVATLSSKPKPSTSNPGSSSETITDLDLTLRLSLPLPTYAHLVIPDALESLLLAKYGKVDTVVLLPGKPPKKSSKSNGEAKEQASAMIIFTRTNLGGCWALWEDCRAGRAGWEGVKAKWANKGVEPEWVARLGKGGDGSGAASTAGQNGAASSTPPPPPTEGGVPSFSFDPTAAMGTPASTTTTAPPQAAEEDYENSTLLRMRQAERERLEREIREADEMEEA